MTGWMNRVPPLWKMSQKFWWGMNKCFFSCRKKKSTGKGAEGREPTEKMETEKALFGGILRSAHFWHKYYSWNHRGANLGHLLITSSQHLQYLLFFHLKLWVLQQQPCFYHGWKNILEFCLDIVHLPPSLHYFLLQNIMWRCLWPTRWLLIQEQLWRKILFLSSEKKKIFSFVWHI